MVQPCSEAPAALMAYSIKFGHNFELQIPYCKQQTLLRPGNEASMEWVSDPPTSISFFSCSLVLNLFWTSLIRLNTCTSPDPAPVPCFEPARKELWRKQRRREYRNGESKVQSPKCKVQSAPEMLNLHFLNKRCLGVWEDNSINPAHRTGKRERDCT